MNETLSYLLNVVATASPFLVLMALSSKANLKKEERHRQGLMPLFSVVFCIVAGLLLGWINALIVDLINSIAEWIDTFGNWIGGIFDGALGGFGDTVQGWVPSIEEFVEDLDLPFWAAVIANSAIATVYAILKPIAVRFLKLFSKEEMIPYKYLCGAVYYHDDRKGKWYVKESLTQGLTLAKTLYYSAILFAIVGIGVSAFMYSKNLIASLYYPVFAMIMVGELYHFLDGEFRAEDQQSTIEGEDDNSSSVCDYTLMRNVLRRNFGDKLLSENTTVNNGLLYYRTNDEVVNSLIDDDETAIEAYGIFMQQKIKQGLDVDQNYLMSGLDLMKGKSILFNNPFYYDLVPYIFYPMNRTILRRKKVLIVLGRHAIEENVEEWCRAGLTEVNHIPSLWNIGVLGSEEKNLDVGIVTRSCVHDLKMHEANEAFFSEVEFVVLIEPSRLVATAQIGLNSLVKHCRRDGKRLVFCTTDKNCDGIVDSLSHILMTSLEEVSATKRHGGTSSYMCWEVDDEHLQHRMLPNLSRYLGVGTELSFTALKNQVSKTCWYGGDAFPVLDMHWIVKQYYFDLLTYAALPAQQSMIDDVFKANPNTWDAAVQDYNYITVEDENYNMFEVKREFATRAKKQGFINVISSDYLLKDYMAANDTLFNADSKAIPYIVADYAGTERNIVYRLCLRLSSYPVIEGDILRELSLIDIETSDVATTLFQSICKCSQSACGEAENEDGLLHITKKGKEYVFDKSIIEIKHKYSYKTGNMENMYSITDKTFIDVFLGDLCSAEYIAEDEKGDTQYLGSELRGHVFQKYLPGQFFTFGGKYYEMQRLSTDGKVVVRRAADHINGRPQYRQVRNYTVSSAVDSSMMGDKRDIGGVTVTKQFADVSVETPAYWQMKRYNDFASSKLITINGVPEREYRNKQILKIEFNQGTVSRKIINTVALLMNEVFRTLYADNQGMIVAVTAGEAEAPLSYSINGANGYQPSENAIYVIEDSQLDLGLLVSVERNIHRIFAIIHDYIEWHREALDVSLNPPPADPAPPDYTVKEEAGEKGIKKIVKAIGRFFKKIGGFFKKIFKAIGRFFKKLFGRKPKDEAEEGIEGETPVAEGENPAGEATEAPEAATEESSNESIAHFSKLYSEAEEEENAPAELEFEADGSKTVSGVAEPVRKPYHERHYLLYGGKAVPENLDIDGAIELLAALGYDNGFLEQARKGKNEAERIGAEFDPNRSGSHFCDFCGTELLGTEYEVLYDGRERCVSCGRTAVKTEKEFKQLYEDVMRNMRVFYGVVIREPVKIKMVNAKTLHRKLGHSFVPTGASDGRILGVAIKDKEGYSILLENGSPRMNATMTMVHEMTHIWQYLNWDEKHIKKLYGKEHNLEIYEGMAKWSEIQYAYLINEFPSGKREEIITLHREDEYGRGFKMYASVYPLSDTTSLKGATPFNDPNKPL